MPIQGLSIRCSQNSAAETVERLKSAITSRGLVLFAHIDQAAAAKVAGLDLLPTDLLLFGNPKAGTHLMAENPAIGIDLPLKALVWQDRAGAVWIGFNAPQWLAERHHLSDLNAGIVNAMAALQEDLAADSASVLPAP